MPLPRTAFFLRRRRFFLPARLPLPAAAVAAVPAGCSFAAGGRLETPLGARRCAARAAAATAAGRRARDLSDSACPRFCECTRPAHTALRRGVNAIAGFARVVTV